MLKFYAFLLMLLGSTVFLFGQTKLIHHKSHSGTNSTFSAFFENDYFNIDKSNFGAAPRMFIKSAALDSLIHLNDTAVVMVTRETCGDGYRPKADPTVWKAGRDTVYHHSLFSLRHELDSIKKTIDELYNFQNSVDEMVFIGYEKEPINNTKEPHRLSSKKQRKTTKSIRKEQKKERKRIRKERKKIKKEIPDEEWILEAPPMGLPSDNLGDPPNFIPSKGVLILFVLGLSVIIGMLPKFRKIILPL